MTDTNAQEPTMEEILASIRRIISEDDAPASNASATAPEAVEEAPEVHDSSAPAEEDDVLELTETVDTPQVAPPPVAQPEPAPAYESVGDIDVFAADEEPGLAPLPAAPSPRSPPRQEEPLVAGRTAESAAAHFGQLTQSIVMPKEGRTLEDVVRELLRPLLKDWLDQNLPGIVEARVQAEVERISRGRGY